MDIGKLVSYLEQKLAKYRVSLLWSLFSGILLFAIAEPLLYLKKEEIQAKQKYTTLNVCNTIISHFDSRINSLIFLSSGLEAYIAIKHSNIDSVEILKLLTEIHENAKEIRNLGIAEGTILKYIAPLKGNEAAIGLDYKTLPKQWHEIEETIKSKKGTLAGPVTLVQKGRALIYRQPIYIDNLYWGLLSTVLDIDSLFSTSLPGIDTNEYEIAIRKSASHIPIYGNQKLFDQSDVIINQATVPNNTWDYAIANRSNRQLQSYNRYVIAIRGLLLLTAILVLVLLAQNTESKLNRFKYKLLSENISDVIWAYNTQECSITYISPSVHSQYGFSTKEIVGKGLNTLFTQESSAILTETISKNKRDFTNRKILAPIVLDLKHKDKVGNSKWTEISAHFKTNTKNEVELIAVTRNIEKRKQEQQLVKQNEARLEAIVNSSMTGISIADEEGIQIFSNKTAETIHGFTPDELLGKTIAEMIPEQQKSKARKIIRQIARGRRRIFEGDCQVFPKDTEQQLWIHFVITQYPALAFQDRPSVLIIYQNITKQKENEEKLTELNKTKNKLFSIIAHDLKNPFLSILGFTRHLLFDKVVDEQEKKEYLKNILSNTENTYKLLENLLEWARSQTGIISFNPTPLIVKYSIDDAITVLQGQAKSKQIKMVSFTDETHAILADSAMFDTIIRNLLSNAIKYTLIGGSVYIRTEKQKDMIKVIIEDTGKGVSQEQIASIFTIEHKTSTPGTENEKGTGLGLILCAEFVQRHNGIIGVENRPSGGAMFYFTMPATEPPKFSFDLEDLA